MYCNAVCSVVVWVSCYGVVVMWVVCCDVVLLLYILSHVVSIVQCVAVCSYVCCYGSVVLPSCAWLDVAVCCYMHCVDNWVYLKTDVYSKIHKTILTLK